MAGQAAKKREKFAKTALPVYLAILVVSLLIHVFFVGFWAWSEFGRLKGFGSVFLAVIGYLTYGTIQEGVLSGVDYTISQDLFFVNVAVAVLTSWSSKWWCLYLIVPGYALFKIGKLVYSYVSTPTAEETKPQKEKKQKQAQRIKYVKA